MVTMTSAIPACNEYAPWDASLGLLVRLKCQLLKSDLVSYSAISGACEKGMRWKAICGLLQEMICQLLMPESLDCFRGFQRGLCQM